MAVHHVHMDPVGAGGFDRVDFLAQLGEIRGQNGWRDEERAVHAGLPLRVRVTCRRDTGNAGGQGVSHSVTASLFRGGMTTFV